MDYTEGIESAFARVAEFVPKLVAFLLILLIGYFVAKVIAKVIDKVLEKVGFDRLVERGGIKQALASSKYDASDLVAKIVFYSLMLIVLNIAFGVFGDNAVTQMLAGVMAFLPKLFVAIIIIVLAAAIAAAVKNIVGAALGGTVATASRSPPSRGIASSPSASSRAERSSSSLRRSQRDCSTRCCAGRRHRDRRRRRISRMRQRWQQSMWTLRRGEPRCSSTSPAVGAVAAAPGRPYRDHAGRPGRRRLHDCPAWWCAVTTTGPPGPAGAPPARERSARPATATTGSAGCHGCSSGCWRCCAADVPARAQRG
jgi:flagellar biosynthesis protein FliQ